MKYQLGMAEYVAKNFENLLNQVQKVTMSETITKKLMLDPSQAEGDPEFRITVHMLHVYYKASAFIDHDVAFVNGKFWVVIRPFNKDRFELAMQLPAVN